MTGMQEIKYLNEIKENRMYNLYESDFYFYYDREMIIIYYITPCNKEIIGYIIDKNTFLNRKKISQYVTFYEFCHLIEKISDLGGYIDFNV